MESKLPNRTERKREETQQKIIRAAVALFQQHGIEAVTMEQIAEAADIAKGTLYNHFASKEAIVNAFLQHTFRQRSDQRIAQLQALPDTRTRLTLIFGQLVEGVQAQKEIFEAFWIYRMKQILSFHPIAEEERSGLAHLIQEVIRLGQQDGGLRTDLPPHMLAELFEFALIEAIKPFYLEPETYDARLAIERSVDLFLRGAQAR